MGRHSAPDDTDEDIDLDGRAVDAVSPLAVLDEPSGRHARGAVMPPVSAEPAEPDALTAKIPLAEIARHDRPLPEETTATIAPVTEAPTGHPRPHPSPEPAAQPREPRQQRQPRGGAHATRHDLALIKTHGDVRARAVAAVLVPFVGYVVVLAVMSALTVHNLIWVWIPAITAGVLVGLVLDAGHKRYPDLASDTPPAPVSGPPGPG